MSDLLIVGSIPGLAIFLILFFPQHETKKWVFACPNFSERIARVKSEFTDFSECEIVKMSDFAQSKRKLVNWGHVTLELELSSLVVVGNSGRYEDGE